MAWSSMHEFTVPVPVEQAWSVLLDVERIAPCMPGATLDSVEATTTSPGRMKVKVGAMTITYRGAATFEDVRQGRPHRDHRGLRQGGPGFGHRRGHGRRALHRRGTDTRVTVHTKLNVTGRPAQFGRGIMAEVGGKLIGRFAGNLAALLGTGPDAEPEAPAPVPDLAGAGKAKEGTEGPRIMEGPEITESLEVAESELLEKEEPVRHLAAVPSSYGFVTTEKAVSREAHPAGTSRTSLSPDEEALDLLEVAGLPLLKRVAPVVAALAGLVLIGWLVRRTLRRR